MAKGNTWTVIGKFKKLNDTEKMKVYTEATSASGYQYRNLKTLLIAGSNSFFCENMGGYFPSQPQDITVYVNGTKGEKGENHKVPWADRKTSPLISKVAGFSKFTIDMEPDLNYRKALQLLVKKAKDNKTITPEELAKVNVDSVSHLVSRLKESLALKQDFLSEYDFIEALRNLIEGGELEDKILQINGTTEYSFYENKRYSKMKIRSVRAVKSDTPAQAEEKIEFFFTDSSVSNADPEETGRFEVDGYVRSYFGGDYKKDLFVPYSLTVVKGQGEKAEKSFSKYHSIFSPSDDGVHSVGIKIAKINGSSFESLTYEDLPEEYKDMVDLDMMTLEDAIHECSGGKQKTGEKISENRLATLMGMPVLSDFTKEDLGNPEPDAEDLPFGEGDEDFDAGSLFDLD